MTLVSLSHSANTAPPMLVTLVPIVTLLRLSTLTNAPSPMLVTLSGIVTLVRPVSRNAHPPMLVRLCLA